MGSFLMYYYHLLLNGYPVGPFINSLKTHSAVHCNHAITKQGPHSKFELTGAKNWGLVENEHRVSKSSEKVHSKTKMAEN